MKTAISIPDDVFTRAERFAREAGRSRSDVYTAAVREYVARHGPEEVTEGLDRALETLGEAAHPDAFTDAAASRALEATEW
jgi:metal-responsive CopG/Arc/MetJ family transcriptional regulator